MANETYQAIVRSRAVLTEALASPIESQPIRKDLQEIRELLRSGDRRGVNRILTSYFERLEPDLHPEAAYDPSSGLLLFKQEEVIGDERKKMYFFFSPREGGIYKKQYLGWHDGTLDFGRGPMFSWPPYDLNDGQFAKVSVIALARMVEEIKRGKVYWSVNRELQRRGLPA